MVVPTIFELNSIKDQLALLGALTSHIDFASYADKEVESDFEYMLEKMDKTVKNLKEKYENLKKLLET